MNELKAEKTAAEKIYLCRLVNENFQFLKEHFETTDAHLLIKRIEDAVDRLPSYRWPYSAGSYEGKIENIEFKLGWVDASELEKDLYKVNLSEKGSEILREFEKIRKK